MHLNRRKITKSLSVVLRDPAPAQPTCIDDVGTHMIQEGSTDRVLASLPQCRTLVWVHPVRDEHPVNELVRSNLTFIRNEEGYMMLFSIPEAAAEALHNADFMHERVKARLGHCYRVQARAKIRNVPRPILQLMMAMVFLGWAWQVGEL